MDKIAKKLDETSKELAKIEIQRRNIMRSEASMKEIVQLCDDENIKNDILTKFYAITGSGENGIRGKETYDKS